MALLGPAFGCVVRGGTTVDGERLEVRGCDLWTFRGNEIVRKDSYWKIVEP